MPFVDGVQKASVVMYNRNLRVNAADEDKACEDIACEDLAPET